jgi:serine/threonine protein kinase
MYRRKDKIGEGGFGAVYRATLDGSTQEYAWKQPKDGASEEETRRFRREVRLLRQLCHDNIMPILTFALEREVPLFIMPLASHSLESVIKDYAANQPEAIELFLDICSGLAYAHEQGVIHRDLKPGNILFVDGIPKVADFGLGRELDRQTTTITQTNMRLGTIAYMAPEQMRDAKDVDHRADVYSLGKILYELLIGELPFPAMELPRLTDGFRYIVEKATLNRPEDRFFSVDELANEVRLLTHRKELLQPLLMQAQAFVTNAAETGDPEQVCTTIAFLKRHPNDSALHLEIVARLPKRLMEVAGRHCNSDLCDILEAFCRHTSGQMAFSFVDVVTDLLRSAFYACERLSTKKLILKHLLQVGYDHNRFYVRTVVRDISENLGTNDEIMVFRDAVKESAGCLAFYEEAFSIRTPEIIRTTLTEGQS